MPTLLVTGGCGFIGANFIRWQLPTYADQQIVNIDKLTYAGNPENLADVASDSRYLFEHGDICDREFVDRVLKDHKPELVVNFAAESHVDRSILDSEAVRADQHRRHAGADGCLPRGRRSKVSASFDG